MKTKLSLILAFIFCEIVILGSVNNYYEQEKEKVLSLNKSIVEDKYNTVTNNLKALADISFKGFVDGNHLVKEAFANRDRDTLYSILKDDYEYLKTLGFKQIHFHLQNSESFLRMHKISKFGDSLKDIRFSVNETNKTLKPTHGIEAGRVLPGYRFVYPLFFKKEHIGSVEFSFGIDKIVQEIEKTYHIHTHFLIEKNLFNSKVFNEYKKYYTQSVEHNNYIKLNRAKGICKVDDIVYDEVLKNLINKNINNSIPFSVEMDNQHNNKDQSQHIHRSITFLPIKNIEKNDTLYFVFYQKSQDLKDLEKSKFNKSIVFSLILIGLFIIIYLQVLRKEQNTKTNFKLQKLLDTQENIVILTNGDTSTFANKRLYTFLGYKDFSSFKEEHKCICELFIENDRFFHLGKIESPKNWIKELLKLPHSKRIVSILGSDFKIHAFSVTINNFDANSYIISFSDITQTMLNHIELEEKIIHDKLTNAYNREYFEQNYQKVIEETKNTNTLLAVALLDIDYFKIVNDTFGHDVGDEVLKHFVKTIQKFSREQDILIRWGGEEFVLLLKVNSKEDLKKALEHIRKVISLQKFPTVGKKTCSIGGTIYQDGENIEYAIKRADEAVYEAKEAGRNIVVIK